MELHVRVKPIGGWDVSSVTNMFSMFKLAHAFQSTDWRLEHFFGNIMNHMFRYNNFVQSRD